MVNTKTSKNASPDIGRSIGTYQVEKSKIQWNLVQSILLIAGVITLSVIAIIQYSRLPTGSIDEQTIVLFSRYAAFGLLFSFFGFLKYGKYQELKSRRVELFERGIKLKERNESRFLRWADISGLYSKATRNYIAWVTTGYSRMIHLEGKNQENLILTDEIESAEELFANIRNRVTPEIYKRIASSFNNGLEVDFGRVSMNRDWGMHIRGTLISWEEISSVVESRGIIRIMDKDGKTLKGGKLRVADIPNVEVFLTLVDQIIGVTKV